jgi:hypothetical protein
VPETRSYPGDRLGMIPGGRPSPCFSDLPTGSASASARLPPRLATAPCLPLPLPREVVDFVGFDVEDDLAATGVLVFDHDLCAVTIFKFLRH